MLLLRKTVQARNPDLGLKKVRRSHSRLYTALLMVRSDEASLTRRQKARPLTAPEREQLQDLIQEHEHLRAEIDQLAHELWHLAGDTDD